MKTAVRSILTALLLWAFGILPAHAQMSSTPTVSTTTVESPAPGQCTQYMSQSIKISSGWNLIGAVTVKPISPFSAFGNLVEPDPTNGVWFNQGTLPNNLVSVWGWEVSAQWWKFYSPLLSSGGVANYAQNHGVNTLKSISPGEGFWVMSKGDDWFYEGGCINGDLIANWGLGIGVVDGWNLLAVPVEMTAEEFAGLFNDGPPTPQIIPGADRVEAVWGWDSVAGKWKFYSPLMLQHYEPGYMDNFIYQKGYTHFLEPLKQGEAVWVKHQSNSGGKGMTGATATIGATTTKANAAGQ